MAKRLTEEKKITDFFAQDVFTDEVMAQYLSAEDFSELKNVRDNGFELHRALADKVADGMKDWAMAHGATHYTHWFQPLTGSTAEKHDSFISIDKDGRTILEFTGKSLCKGEADASSLPSMGIRATFEARGYTVWDVNSPAFIKTSTDGAGILYIPTAFCAYTGEALDKKTPLLRSMSFVNAACIRLLRLLGDNETKRVIPSVGGEQEYFLVDKDVYRKRDDLIFTGRTLFGALPPKGQEKNDQYYADIKERVLSYMADLNEELWKKGITAKTQHNEAAPAQHELAPIYSSANIATDQNQLIMEMMKKVADRHHLACLLHEKPFRGVNGSGKHNNWSLTTDSGRNLLSPGPDPQTNRQFMLFFLATIAGVDDYADLLRMSASSAGNDRRLGGNEAPPAIISVFVGDVMGQVLEHIMHREGGTAPTKTTLKMGVSNFPTLKRDLSDRNRTSPFAFTGDKFEFRMVGSSQTLATPNIVLNTIVGDKVNAISDALESAVSNGEKLEDAIDKLICEYATAHKRVIFNGNNYTVEWSDEAKRRGLPVITSAVDAFEALNRKEVKALWSRTGVLTERESESRREIYLSDYSKTINIEALTMLSIAKTQVLPAVMKFENELAQGLCSLRALCDTQTSVSCSSRMPLGSVQQEKLEALDRGLVGANLRVTELERAVKDAQSKTEVREKAVFYRDKVVVIMDELRSYVDDLQELVGKSDWPYPNYASLLFYD